MMIRNSFSLVQYRGAQLAVALSPRTSQNRRALIFGVTAAAMFLLFFGSPVFAVTNIATVVCGWAPTVGAIGTALAFIVFIAGLAMIAVGSQQGFGRTIWAILGAVALFGATGLFTALTAGNCGDPSA